MRVLDQNKDQGLVKLRIDGLEDLWHLDQLISVDDLVRGVTHRRLDDQQDMVRDKAQERVTVTLGVRVEETEFHEPSQRLRVLGLIEEAPETVATGSHHTIAFGEHDWVEIVKTGGWPKHALDRVEEAVEETGQPRVVIVSMDETEGTVAVLYPFGVREIGSARKSGGGKQYKNNQDGSQAYYAELRHILDVIAPDDCPVVVVGPGFARENFVDHLDEHPVEGIRSMTTNATGQAGMAGVQEALKRGVIKGIAKDSRIARETEAVEELLTRLGQDRPVTYGPEEVEKALNYGAVEQLLILDELVKEGDGERLIELAHQTGADAMVISAGHDAGQKLANLTGVGAILRFEVEG